MTSFDQTRSHEGHSGAVLPKNVLRPRAHAKGFWG